MIKFSRHIRVGIAALLTVIVSVFPVYAAAIVAPVYATATTPQLIISEFQTNGGSASQEFIELYNMTDQDIDFAGQAWKLQFFNSTAVKAANPNWSVATTASNSISLTGTVSAHDYYLLASTNYLPGGYAPDQVYAPSSSHLMTDTGGGLQVLEGNLQTAATTWHDRVMWLARPATGSLPDGLLLAPLTGKSLQRLPNDDTEYMNIAGDLVGFSGSEEITPFEAWLPPVVIAEPTPIADPGVSDNDPVSDDNPVVTVTAPVSNSPNLVAPLVTELLPNPAAPLTDAHDEFIELYNPNTAAFDLKGYSLEVGTTTLHRYSFTSDVILAPSSYQAFYSAETGLSLSNSGGQARLRDSTDLVASESTVYGAAADGQSWILNDGVWQWTTTPTPAMLNVLAAPVTSVKATTTKAATKTVVPKTTTTKTSSKTTAKTAAKVGTKQKTSTVKKAKITKKSTTKKLKAAAITTAALTKPKPPIHKAVLVVVVLAAVLYGLYEYRHDISDRFRQLRTNRSARAKVRVAPARR